jgi:signal transduction histidine kinase
MVAAQETGAPVERECVLTAVLDKQPSDHTFMVRSCPFVVENEQVLLVAMRDITDEKRRMAMERAFLHDLSNVLTALVGSSELLATACPPEEAKTAEGLVEAAATLADELRIQRLLLTEGATAPRLKWADTRPSALLERLHSVFNAHPAGRNQVLAVVPSADDAPLRTDAGLLLRVLGNMVVNAFEAGKSGDEVRVWADNLTEGVAFRVWNPATIPANVVPRIFQRYFSTKLEPGRGLGTYAMKVLGEGLLGGAVTFRSAEDEGTTFEIRVPWWPALERAGASAR